MRVDAEQGVPRRQAGQKPWILAGTLQESGPVLPDAMGRQVAAWDRRRRARPRAGGPGRQHCSWEIRSGAQAAQPRVSITALDCLPQTLDFTRLEDHRRKLSQCSPLLASCSDMVIPPGLRDSPAPRHSVTLRPTLCSLEAAAHFRLPVALGPSPSTQSAGPRKPSGSAPPLFTHSCPSGDLQAISGLRAQYWATKHVEWRGFSTPKERPGPGPSPRACHSQPQAKQG